MVMVAVQDFDVHAGLGHPSCNHAELTGDCLFQALYEHLSFCHHADANAFKGCAGCGCVLEEKMSYAIVSYDPGPASLDAHGMVARFGLAAAPRGRAVSESRCRFTYSAAPRACG